MKRNLFEDELKSIILEFKSKTEEAILKNNQEILDDLDFREKVCYDFRERYLDETVSSINEQFEKYHLPYRAVIMEHFSKSLKSIIKLGKSKPPVKLSESNINFDYHLKIFNSSITEGRTPLATLIISPDPDKVTFKGPITNNKEVIELPKKDFDKLINSKILDLIRIVLRTPSI